MKSFVQKQEKSLQPEKLSHYTCSTIVWQIPAVLPFQAFGILALKIAGKTFLCAIAQALTWWGGGVYWSIGLSPNMVDTAPPPASSSLNLTESRKAAWST